MITDSKSFEPNSYLLSKSGCTKPFDSSADGYVRGEGVVVMILKRAENLSENDKLYSNIKGCSIGHTGTSPSLTAPTVKSQVENIRRSITKSGLSPNDIQLVECGSPASLLSDYVEVNAIKKVFDKNEKAVYLTSVKRNIGHVECASGMAGILKTILCMHKKCIPKCPEGTFQLLNPKINVENTSVKIQTTEVDLKPKGEINAMVNSFGFNGAMAHIIIGDSGMTNDCLDVKYESPFKNRVNCSKKYISLKVCQNTGCGPCSNPILLDPDINNAKEFCATCLIKELQKSNKYK